MSAWPLVVLAIALANAAASWAVLRIPVFSATQRRLQLLLIWLVPILGAIICVVFARSQALGPASPSTFDPLYHPSDGGGPDGPGLGICGCEGSAGDGTGGGD